MNSNETIDTLEIAVRSHFALKRMGINYISELIECSEADLLAVRNIGTKVLLDIKRALNERGLMLREDE